MFHFPIKIDFKAGRVDLNNFGLIVVLWVIRVCKCLIECFNWLGVEYFKVNRLGVNLYFFAPNKLIIIYFLKFRFLSLNLLFLLY